jgi:hypothetical protein
MRGNVAFGLLNIANFTEDDDNSIHLTANVKITFFFVAGKKIHCI